MTCHVEIFECYVILKFHLFNSLVMSDTELVRQLIDWDLNHLLYNNMSFNTRPVVVKVWTHMTNKTILSLMLSTFFLR